MKTLQNQYNLIKKGKGDAEVFMKASKKQFPNFIRNAANLNETIFSLKHNHIISENMLGLGIVSSNRTTTPDWFKIFNNNVKTIKEEAKAVEKQPTKDVVDLETKGYNYKDKDEVNNLNFAEFLHGYYTEMKNPKNSDKTEQELKDIVKKNLEKNPSYYVENTQFGVEGIGYTKDNVGLKPTQVKNPGIGGGYGEATKKEFPKGAVGTGYLELGENRRKLKTNLLENLPLGEKLPPKPKSKKIKKETTDSKLSEIDKNGRIATLEIQIEALDDIISSKNERISMVSEDDSLSELMDKKKIKEMQKEINLLEKRKTVMEKLYEKMCGKSYTKKEMVSEDDESDDEYEAVLDKLRTSDRT